MKEIKIFENEEFGQIRTITIDGEPWFVGKDVAEALGYVDAKVAIRVHVDSDDKQIIQRGKTDTFGIDSDERHLIERSQNVTFEIPNRGLTIINESGLYSLIMGSHKKNAKRFKRWVTSEVLPSIRKKGSYGYPETQDQLTEQIRKQVADMLVQTVPVIVSETVKQLAPVISGHTERMEQPEPGRRNRTRVVSKVDFLPPELKSQVICMLLDPRITYNEISIYTEEHGNRVSKSALCRYSKKLERETGGYEVEMEGER